MRFLFAFLAVFLLSSQAMAQPAPAVCNTPGLSCLYSGTGNLQIQAAPITTGSTASVNCGTSQPVNDAAALTITLPAYCPSNMPVTIKDIGGNASVYNITIELVSGDIDGAATQTIANSYGEVSIVWTPSGVAGVH